MAGIIRLAIVATATQAVREFAKAEHATEHFHEKTKDLGRELAGMAVGAIGIGAVADAFKDGVSEASKFQDAARQTAQALSTNAHLAGLTVAQVQETSAAIKNLTGAKLSENDVTLAQNKLIRAGVADRGTLEEATKTAADVALGSGRDLSAVSTALARALANPAKAQGVLARAGVVLSEEQSKAIKSMAAHGDAAKAQGAVLAALESHYKGAAKAAGTGFSADVGRAKASLEESERDIALGFLPTLSKLATAFASALPGAIAVVKGPLETVVGLLAHPAFLAAVGVIAGLVLAWKAYQTVMLISKEVTIAYTAVQAALDVVLDANPIGLLVLAIVGLIAGFVLAYKNCATFRRIVDEALHVVAQAFRGMFSAAAEVFDWLKNNWDLILPILIGPIGLIILIYRRFGDTIIGFFSSLPRRIRTATTGMFDGIKEAFRSAVNFIIRGWNDLSLSLPAVDTHIPGVGAVGGFTLRPPHIPLLASGGIVTGPTLAVLGEAGPEAVIPLSQLGGNAYHITVNVAPTSDPAEVGRHIVRAIEAYQGRSGRGVLAA